MPYNVRASIPCADNRHCSLTTCCTPLGNEAGRQEGKGVFVEGNEMVLKRAETVQEHQWE